MSDIAVAHVTPRWHGPNRHPDNFGGGEGLAPLPTSSLYIYIYIYVNMYAHVNLSLYGLSLYIYLLGQCLSQPQCLSA